LSLGGGDHIGDGFVTTVAVSSQHHRRITDGRNRRKNAFDVVRYVLEQRGVDRDVAGRDHDQRIAVWRCSCRVSHGDETVGARPILNDDLLPPSLGQLRADDPRRDIRNAAGCVGHEDSDRPRRVVLRQSGPRGAHQKGDC